MKPTVVIDQLVKLLQGEMAHMSFEEAVADFPLKRINESLPHTDYTPWRLLEHMRLTQEEIIVFIKTGPYQDPVWPDDYWPDSAKQATPTDWHNTINGFIKDRDWLIQCLQKAPTKLTDPLKHRGKQYNLFRQIRIVGNHNSYHIGEFAILRPVMNTWKSA